MDVGALAIVWIFAVIFGLVLLVCWIVLPFAVIGTKDLLRDLLIAQNLTNDLLTKQQQVVRQP